MMSKFARKPPKFKSPIISSHSKIHKHLKNNKHQKPVIIIEKPDLPEIINSVNKSPKRKRSKYSYEENHTAALALPLTTENLEIDMSDASSMLEDTQEFIIEHARRRVELFFYTLVAYYNKGYIPVQGHTFMQHGRGRNAQHGENITQACHSSFFGAFVDTSPETHVPQCESDIQHSILTGTHLLNSLNATVELPAFVNKFDDELEIVCKCRENGLKILRRVALGELNPIEGLSEFFKMMQQAFSDIDNHVVLSKKGVPYLLKDTPDSPIDIKEELIKLIKHGTFAKKWNFEEEGIECEYMDMLLRLSPAEKEMCKENSTTRLECYEKKILEIQNEILSNREDLQPPADNIRRCLIT